MFRDIIRAIRNTGYDMYKEEVYISVATPLSIEEERVLEDKLKSLPGIIDARVFHASRRIVVFNSLS